VFVRDATAPWRRPERARGVARRWIAPRVCCVPARPRGRMTVSDRLKPFRTSQCTKPTSALRGKADIAVNNRNFVSWTQSRHLRLVCWLSPRCKCSVRLRLAKHVRTAERCSSVRPTSQSPEVDSHSRSTYAASSLSIEVDGRVTGQMPLPPVRSNALRPPAWKRTPRGWREPRSFRCRPAWPCCARDRD
jgi:hypothetical protein